MTNEMFSISVFILSSFSSEVADIWAIDKGSYEEIKGKRKRMRLRKAC